MAQTLSRQQVADELSKARRIAMPGCSGQSLWIDQLLREMGDNLGKTEFSGVFIPGINTEDYAALGRDCSSEVFFLMPSLRDSYKAGRIRYLPIPYTVIADYYRDHKPFDLCVVQVSPPDSKGRMSFGLSADFSPIAAGNSRRILAHINPNMPATSGPYLTTQQVDFLIEAESPLLTVPLSPASNTLAAVAQQIAMHIPNGATLQFGLGKMQRAMLESLTQHQNLRIHSGMVSDPVLGLLEAGAIQTAPDSITTGTLLGGPELYRRLPSHTGLTLAPVSYTHRPETLAAIPNLYSINSALAVDLLGQINADLSDGAQISGCGGLVDFMRGARLAPGGASLIALPATAAGGQISRIQACLQHQPVSVPRGDVDAIATEYGIAWLRHRSVEERARALIGIAAPQHRDELEAAWKQLQKHL